MRVSDILSAEGGARDLLNDTAEAPNQRWTQKTLYAYLDEAQRKLVQLRPDALYVANIVTTSPDSLAVVERDTDEIPVRLVFKTALVYYVVFRALARDSEDTANQARSKDFQLQFMAAIQ